MKHISFKKIFLFVLLSFVSNILFLNNECFAYSNKINYKKYNNHNLSINVYNWGEFISDGSDGNLSVNKEFEKLTGIKVNYSTFASNEELYAKIRNKSSKYDVIIPSDYMISRMINEDMLRPLDLKKIPNYKNIRDDFKNPEYDINNKYSIPYMWGTVGIIYNKSLVNKPVNSWNILWDKDFAGQILMFSNSRDSFGISLKRLGFSINSTNEDEIYAASNEILKQKELVQAYVMDEIFNKMENNEAAIAPYYSGDAITMMKENANLDFCYPKEGTNKFVDAMCIPKDANNIELSYLYINFISEPEIALVNSKYIGYSTPNKVAFDLLDDDIKNNKIAYPSQQIMSNAKSYIHLPNYINKLIDSEWTKIMSINNSQNKWLIPIFIIVGIFISIFINVFRFIKNKKLKLF